MKKTQPLPTFIAAYPAPKENKTFIILIAVALLVVAVFFYYKKRKEDASK